MTTAGPTALLPEATEITSGPVLMMPGRGVKFDQNHDNIYAKDIINS